MSTSGEPIKVSAHIQGSHKNWDALYNRLGMSFYVAFSYFLRHQSNLMNLHIWDYIALF